MTNDYRYEVTTKTRGDWTEPSGPESVVYKGPNQEDAMSAAHEAANESGVVVVIRVSKVWKPR